MKIFNNFSIHYLTLFFIHYSQVIINLVVMEYLIFNYSLALPGIEDSMKRLILFISMATLLSFSVHAELIGELHPQLQEEIAADTITTKNAEILIEQYCYACHSPQMRGQQRLAPPFQMVQMHYLRDYPAKEDFINAISAWVKEPNADNSIMPGALNRFGLMPPMMMNEDDVKLIADYLFDTDLPDFRGHGNGRMHRRQGRSY